VEIKNKIAVITGGSDGLGLAIAKLFTNKGAVVHIVGRNQERLQKAKESSNSKNLFIHQSDVSNYQSVKNIYDEIGNIDILINNAGIWLEGMLTDNDEKLISKTIDINLKGVIYSTKAVLPEMIKRNEGIIFNVSSTSGLSGKELQSVYVASKFGVRGFTESLELDLASTNIKVFGFYPGGMNTDLFKKAGSLRQTQDWMKTEKVAEVVLFMIENDDSMVVNQVTLKRGKVKTSN
jgi:NADP-dependent 3-hydroxy acid dehydrogenase YdfG